MRTLEKRILTIEGRQKPCQVGVVQFDDKQLQAGITAEKQIADQEAKLGYSVPAAKREFLLNETPRPGGMLVSFFTRED